MSCSYCHEGQKRCSYCADRKGPVEQLYEGYEWIKVKHVEDPWKFCNEYPAEATYDYSAVWQEWYGKLADHHTKETEFLIEEVRRLARLLDDAEVDPTELL